MALTRKGEKQAQVATDKPERRSSKSAQPRKSPAPEPPPDPVDVLVIKALGERDRGVNEMTFSVVRASHGKRETLGFIQLKLNGIETRTATQLAKFVRDCCEHLNDDEIASIKMVSR